MKTTATTPPLYAPAMTPEQHVIKQTLRLLDEWKTDGTIEQDTQQQTARSIAGIIRSFCGNAHAETGEALPFEITPTTNNESIIQ